MHNPPFIGPVGAGLGYQPQRAKGETMKTGLLWADYSGKDTAEKVTGAARRYYRKHGQPPNVCYVHLSSLPDGKPLTVGVRLMREGEPSLVEVRPLPSMLRHHFWIGVEDDA